jgi:ribonuclease T1
MNGQAWRIARIVIVLLLVSAGTALQLWREKNDAPTPPPAAARPAAEQRTPAPAEQAPAPQADAKSEAEKKSPETRPSPKPAASKADTTVENVTICDLSDRVVFQGDVDLSDTLARIDAGRRLKNFRNDGTVFQNRERRLPTKPSGYYREWVHPTPGFFGPGPQRIVTGEGGEAFYTPDHYRTFEKIR